jgi:hypothetical protein
MITKKRPRAFFSYARYQFVRLGVFAPRAYFYDKSMVSAGQIEFNRFLIYSG